MWEQLRQFSALERPARRTFFFAATLLPFIAWSLRLRGFSKTRAALEKHFSRPRPAGEAYCISPDLSVRMVRAAARYGLSHPTCLQESLALWFILGRQGIACDLRVGVRKQSDQFEAHAWVERQGVPLNEPAGVHQHYAVFDAALASIAPER